MVSKLKKAVLIGSLGQCFRDSMDENESVEYIKNKHGDLYDEDFIKHVFNIMRRTNKPNPGEANIMSMLEKEILLESLEFCLSDGMSKEDTVRHMAKYHCGLFEEDTIKRLFDILTKINHLKGIEDLMLRSLITCLREYFTEEEAKSYLKKRHPEIYNEKNIETRYSHVKETFPNYQAIAEGRCKLRRLLTQEEEWTTEEKMEVIQGRLALLSHSDRDMVVDFTEKELETLGFFMTKEHLTEEFDKPYSVSGSHDLCFHCHCMECYLGFSKYFQKEFSEEKKHVVDHVLSQLDVAEET